MEYCPHPEAGLLSASSAGAKADIPETSQLCSRLREARDGWAVTEQKAMKSEKLYLDDLQVGQRFTSGSHLVDETQIKTFAGQFDPQPFHLDDAAAKHTLFGGLAASGWHTAAITMRLLVDTGLPLAGGIIGAGGDIAWPSACRPGDVLTVTSEVVEITPSRSRPDRGMVRVRSETRNQRNEIVQVLNARLVVPRKVERAQQS